jgi:hypothetical protein
MRLIVVRIHVMVECIHLVALPLGTQIACLTTH